MFLAIAEHQASGLQQLEELFLGGTEIATPFSWPFDPLERHIEMFDHFSIALFMWFGKLSPPTERPFADN